MSGVTSLLATLAMLALSVQTTTSVELSQQDVAQALADGARNEQDLPLRPFLLERRYGRPPGPTVAIYTPYLRIALASRVAHRQKKSLTPADLPEWITSPNLLIVFRAPCPSGNCTYEHTRVHTYTPDMPPSFVFSGPFTTTDDHTRPRTPPLGIERDLAFLDVIGGKPFDDAVLAATFAIDTVQPATSLVARWDFGKDHVFSGGQVTAADLQQWRSR
jgi:hypothetical protein